MDSQWENFAQRRLTESMDVSVDDRQDHCLFETHSFLNNGRSLDLDHVPS